MSITLNPRTEDRIKQLVSAGRYPDADAVIDDALHALEAQTRARFEETRRLILAGLNGGDGVIVTDEFWEEIELKADEADRLGLPIRDAIQP